MDPLQSLEHLLARMFSPAELLRLLSRPAAGEIRKDVHESAPLAELSHQAVAAWNRRAWLRRPEVWLLLRSERPACEDDISQIEGQFRASGRPAAATSGQGESMSVVEYVECTSSLHSLAQELSDAIGPTSGNPVATAARGQIEAMCHTLAEPTFWVVLAGPSRAGKSSLFNSLIELDASPVDTMPTTAVGIVAVPSLAEQPLITVTFQDGRELTVSSTSEIAQYATQKQNRDNQRGVSLVSISARSRTTDRGVAVADIPGLHDPSESMREISRSLLERARAVVYVLDASSFRDGGFSINRNTIEDLRSLGSCPIVLTLNKCDRLTKREVRELKKYTAEELDRHGASGVESIVPVSADPKTKRGRALGITGLEEYLVDMIVRHRLTGFQRLYVGAASARKAIGMIRVLDEARLAGAAHAEEMEVWAARAVEKMSECRERLRHTELGLHASIDHMLRESTDRALVSFETRLRSLGTETALPNVDTTTEWLRHFAFGSLRAVELHVDSTWVREAEFLGKDVENALNIFNVQLGVPSPPEDHTPTLPGVRVPAFAIDAPVALGTIGTLLGLAGGPGVWLFGLLAGTAIGQALGFRGQRAQRVSNYTEEARRSFAEWLPLATEHLRVRSQRVRASLEADLDRQLGHFAAGVQEQLRNSGGTMPEAEQKWWMEVRSQLAKAEAKLGAVERRIDTHLARHALKEEDGV